MGTLINLTGQTFGRLTVLERAGSYHKNGNVQWECRCDCGNIPIIRGQNLTSGRSRSCGCLNKMFARKRKLTHGMRKSPEYTTWSAMVQRCTNPKATGFEHYGGRGIDIFDEWKKSFIKFYEYIGHRPSLKYTIERINNDKGYVPGNVKWATRKEQADNKRGLHLITFGGQTKSLSRWAESLNMNPFTLKNRIVTLKWPIERAFNEPVRHRSPLAL